MTVGRTDLGQAWAAARAAAHIVGQAGELAAKEFGEATLATDALSQFPGCFGSSVGRGLEAGENSTRGNHQVVVRARAFVRRHPMALLRRETTTCSW